MSGDDRECPAPDHADVVAFYRSRRRSDLVRGRRGRVERTIRFVLYKDFNIKKRDVHGFVALLMDMPSIAALKAIVNDFISAMRG
jgi:hypothetical protein